MLPSRLLQLAGVDRLERRPDVSRRAVTLAFGARFVDEVLSGAFTVLAPTFRRVFGLSLIQVGLLMQVLGWVALVVEPVSASLIDVRSRRVLLAFGAAALAVSITVMGAAPTYPMLLLGFALYGVGSGPLAHTADVVVVEAFPTAPERAFNRATIFDTTGALLGPAAIALAAWAGLSWRWVLIGLGGGAILYAVALGRTAFPAPAPPNGSSLIRAAGANVRSVLRNGAARRWLLVLLWFDLFEAAFILQYVWLHDTVGLSEPLVAMYAVGENAVALSALLLLDRWLRQRDAERLFRIAAGALVVLPSVWVAAPGVAGRVVVGMVLTFAHAMIWPIAKARSLIATPLAGASQAITTLFPLLPLALGEAWLADTIGIGPAMAGTAAVGAALMLATVPATGRA